MKKNIIIISLIITFIFTNNVFSSDKYLNDLSWYELYQKRVTDVCSLYKFDSNNSETIYLMDDSNKYLNLDKNLWIESDTIDIVGEWMKNSYRVWKDIELAKEQYKTNMDWIYNCAVNKANFRWLSLVKKTINNYPELKEYENIIDQKQNEIKMNLESSWESSKCKLNSEKNDPIIKANVLKQATYELCRYNYYLEYLKEVNDDISKLDESVISDSENAVWINKILEIQSNKIQEINKEIEDAYRAFPIAFKAYSEYENYITSHILLELLRQNYLKFREELHKNLNPINQVVYKISNAMRK